MEENLKAVIMGKCSSTLFKAGHLNSRWKCGIQRLKSNREERNSSSIIHANLYIQTSGENFGVQPVRAETISRFIDKQKIIQQKINLKICIFYNQLIVWVFF